MKLYYMPGACSLATHIVLEWTGAKYETQKITHDQLKSPEYLKVNPMGAVPALEVDGHILTQNAGALNYLAEAHPEARLRGDGTPLGVAEVERWLGFVNSDVHPAYKPLFGSTGYLEDEAMIEKSKVNARQRLRQLFKILNDHMKGRDWIAGPTRSIADPYLYVMLRWAKAQKIDLSGLDDLERFFARVSADEGVKKVLIAESAN